MNENEARLYLRQCCEELTEEDASVIDLCYYECGERDVIYNQGDESDNYRVKATFPYLLDAGRILIDAALEDGENCYRAYLDTDGGELRLDLWANEVERGEVEYEDAITVSFAIDPSDMGIRYVKLNVKINAESHKN
jgi:hypothetical protein